MKVHVYDEFADVELDGGTILKGADICDHRGPVYADDSRVKWGRETEGPDGRTIVEQFVRLESDAGEWRVVGEY